MRLRVYEQLYLVNLHLVEASRELEALAKTLKFDRTALRLMTEQIEELRRDANCTFAHLLHDRELLASRAKPSRNWRLHDIAALPPR